MDSQADDDNIGQEDEEECPVDAPRGFSSKYDDFGSAVFEIDGSALAKLACAANSTEASSASMPCIRLQARPDACLRGVNTAADVEAKIRQVREHMDQYRPSDLYTRQWEPHPSSDAETGINNASNTSTAHAISVMQFNTLAEGLSSGTLEPLPFGKSIEYRKDDEAGFGGFTALPHPEVCLDYSNRRWRILEVLLGKYCQEQTIKTHDNSSDGGSGSIAGSCPFDIIGMEEVDRFGGFFAPALSLFGYQGIFNAKPRAPGVQFGYYSDGCALFWKADKFDLVCKARRSFRIGTQVYLLATLRHKESGRPIVVAVTHLKASKSEENARIRALQSQELLEILQEKAARIAENCSDTREVPTIVLGDFNAEPSEDAAKNFVDGIDNGSLQSFASAYPADIPYSTWKTRGTNTVRRVIDYIFYKPCCNVDGTPIFECKEFLALPAEEDMEEQGMPGFRSPSDHLALAARFYI